MPEIIVPLDLACFFVVAEIHFFIGQINFCQSDYFLRHFNAFYLLWHFGKKNLKHILRHFKGFFLRRLKKYDA